MAFHPRKQRPVAVRLGDSELVKIGARRYDWRSPYRFALSLSWPTFFALMASVDLAINVVFALLFVAGDHAISNARPGSLLDAFFFSVETFSTVGYGVLSPGSLYGHIVATADILFGLAFTALFTGLIFVRFSKPRASLIYADHPVVARHNGRPTLMIRFASCTATMMTGATARLNLLMLHPSDEGRSFRRSVDLPLVRSYIPVLLLAWTLMHEIDENSPLFGMTEDDMIEADTRLLLTIEVRDHAIGTTVVDVKTYAPSDVLFGVAYQDIVTFDRSGRTQVDLRRISNVEPDRGFADDNVAVAAAVE